MKDMIEKYRGNYITVMRKDVGHVSEWRYLLCDRYRF